VYEVVESATTCKRFSFSVVDAVVRGPAENLQRSWVRHEATVATVAVTDDGRVPLIRQYRASIGEDNLELPGGRVDPGEEPAAAAGRELQEEVGWRAGSVADLGSFLNSPGHCTQRTLLFLAADLVEVGRELDGGEEATASIEYVRLADVHDVIAAGRVQDAKTIIGLMLAARRLGAGT
jgi:ADP-ribose pyrophosphatase